MKWDKQKITEVALRYQTRTKFQLGHGGAYAAAVRLGILDEVTSHMKVFRRTHRSESQAISIARRYRTRSELAKDHPSIIRFIHSHKISDVAFSHMVSGRIKWDTKELQRVASKYTSMKMFKRQNKRAFAKAANKGIVDQLCSHMIDDLNSCNTLYVWRLVGCSFEGNPVYKIGVTSSWKGDSRIVSMSQKNATPFDIILMIKLKKNVYDVEKELLMIGEPPDIDEFKVMDGFTELRALSDDQLDELLIKLFKNRK